MTYNFPNPFNLDPQVTLDNAVRAVEALIAEIVSAPSMPPKVRQRSRRDDLSWSDRLFLRSVKNT